MWATEDEGLTGVTFDSDGHRLVGVLYLARGEEPKPTVLLLHGCPGLEKNLDLAVRLRDRGWNSLLFHYRGCWGSAGRYDLRTIPRDVTAAVDYLAGCPRVDAGRIAVLGHSLGGWAALVTAAAEPRLRAVAVYGAAARLGADLRLSPDQLEQEFTRFLATTPEEFACQAGRGRGADGRAGRRDGDRAAAAAGGARHRGPVGAGGAGPGAAGAGRTVMPLRRGGGGRPRLLLAPGGTGRPDRRLAERGGDGMTAV